MVGTCARAGCHVVGGGRALPRGDGGHCFRNPFLVVHHRSATTERVAFLYPTCRPLWGHAARRVFRSALGRGDGRRGYSRPNSVLVSAGGVLGAARLVVRAGGRVTAGCDERGAAAGT